MCPIPLFVLLLQVEDRDSVPNWTDNNVAISGEVQISLAIDCAEQIGKLQNKRKVILLLIISQVYAVPVKTWEFNTFRGRFIKLYYNTDTHAQLKRYFVIIYTSRNNYE